MTKTISLSALLATAVMLLFVTAAQAATVTPDDLSAGDLIRGESFSAVYYYGEDGLRYVFPNDKTYFTWYDDFDDVKWLTDSDMSSIQIGGNVTYKPGVKMIKIQSDPTVYAIGAGGTLRAIDSEEVAIELYGSNWSSLVDDVPDGFFPNYTHGSDLEFASQFDPDVEVTDAQSIDDDKGLHPALQIEITDNGYSIPTATISSGTAVRWTNTGSENESASEWDGEWGSGTLEPGDHYTRYFTLLGTWSYYSKNTDQTLMGGALIVE